MRRRRSPRFFPVSSFRIIGIAEHFESAFLVETVEYFAPEAADLRRAVLIEDWQARFFRGRRRRWSRCADGPSAGTESDLIPRSRCCAAWRGGTAPASLTFRTWRVPERPSHCQHSAEVIGPGQAQRAARPAATPVVPESRCAASSIAKAAGVEALSTRNPIWPLLRGDIFHHFAWKSSTRFPEGSTSQI